MACASQGRGRSRHTQCIGGEDTLRVNIRRYLHHLAELEIEEHRQRRIERNLEDSDSRRERASRPSTGHTSRPRSTRRSRRSVRAASSTGARTSSRVVVNGKA
jgi:hypothetical protein